MRQAFPYTLGLLLAAAITTTARSEALEKPVAGPRLVCFKYSVFSLLAGERITDMTASPEGMLLKVDGPATAYDVGESEIFAGPTSPKKLVLSHDHTTVYRVSGGKPFYAL
jgi:hypothetical protein